MKTARIVVISFAMLAALGIAILALAAAPSGIAYAQGVESTTATLMGTGTITSTGTLTDTGTISGTVASNQKVADAIAKYYDVPLDDILALRDKGMGYGEIVIAFNLANKIRQPVDQILTLRESGQGWGKIAQSLAVKPGNKGENLGSIMRGRNSKGGAKEPPSTDEQDEKQDSGNGKGNGKGKSK